MFFEGCSVCAGLCPTMGQELPAGSLRRGKMCFIQIGIISSPNPLDPSGLASVNDQVLRPNCYSCSRRMMGGARSCWGRTFRSVSADHPSGLADGEVPWEL